MERKRLNRPGCGLTGQWTAGVGMEWRQGRLCVRQRERGTRAAVTQRARVTCLVIEKLSNARPRNQARVTEQDVRKRLMGMRFARVPPPVPPVPEAQAKRKKVPDFIKPKSSTSAHGGTPLARLRLLGQ